MALDNVQIYDPAGHNTVPTWKWQVAAGVTLLRGEPCKLTSAGSPYVIRLADDEPVIGTTTDVIGITASTATATASADGTVDVYMPLPGIVYECSATTAANIDTQTELNALVGDRVLFDLSSTTFTVDENAGTGATKGLLIIGGTTSGKIYFTIDSDATAL
jgi:hypothetical protein